MKTTSILIVLLISSCTSKKREITIPPASKAEIDIVQESATSTIEPYDFDTILRNGYHLSYRVYPDTLRNGNIQSLTLVKGNKDIETLNETSYPMLHKNLGYIGGDYGNTFLFVKSYGSGNPHEMQLIEKKSGKTVAEGAIVDQRVDEKVLLYIKNLHNKNEKLILLDLKNKKEKYITDFNNLKCERIGGLRSCVVIDTVTSNEILLKAYSEKDSIVRRYNR